MLKTVKYEVTDHNNSSTLHTGKKHGGNPSSQKQATQNFSSSSTTRAVEGTEGRTNIFPQHQETSNIYSNVTVSSEAPGQPENLLYSTVNFSKRTDAVTHKSLNQTESTLYSSLIT